MPEPQILVEELEKRFGSTTVLSGVNMRVERSEVAVIIGGSGAGKTTLLRVLIGLERATAGRVVVAGVDLAQLSERELNRARRKFGMVFQYSALLDSMNVFDNVAFPLREHSKLKERQIRDKVLDKLKVLGLEGTGQRFPSQLSGGMRKRVGLARALMLEPEVLMYDEPTSGLDPITSRTVDDLILETRERFGVTSVVISHDMAGALQIADRIFVLAKGRVAASGTPRELASGTNEIVAEYIQSSGIQADRLLREHDERDAKQANASARSPTG
ncbi:MAG TPA: ABC transporter ATP-binding protein [Polyangiaceae bacterium]|nr:ABC transporter ATP-binding protein [Polyangiaceae bacterium]